MFDRVLNTPVNILVTSNPVFFPVLQKNSFEKFALSGIFLSKTSSNFCSYLAHFPAQARKIKKLLRKKLFLFPETGFSISNIKKILIYSQKEIFSYIFSKETFLVFPEMEPCTFQPKLEK